MTTKTRLLSSFCLLMAVACTPPPQQAHQDPDKPETSASTPGESADASTEELLVKSVRGVGGVITPDLPEGAFLGAGAHVPIGREFSLPKGNLAELTLPAGGTLRVNEDSRLQVAADGSVQIHTGEVVVLVPPGSQPVTVHGAEGEHLEVRAGEARMLRRDNRRQAAVVYGQATAIVGGKRTDLGPGAALDLAAQHVADTPTPETPSDAPKPTAEIAVASLAPLEDTKWSRSFETATQLAADVPLGVGSLTARRAGSSVHRQSLEIVDQKVHVSISGRMAHTQVEQTFYNKVPAVLEGTYRFPLPTDASISGLSLLVGAKWMDAEMLEKKRAARIFRSIVEATVPRDPALLHWEHGNIFKLKVFPIPGRGERSIRLSYTQMLPVSGDRMRYRYPLSGAGGGATGTRIENFEFKLDIDGNELPTDAAEAVETSMMDFDRTVAGDRVQLHATRQDFRPTYDIGVDIPVAPEDSRVHTETHLDRDGQAYFMVAFKPEFKGGASRASVSVKPPTDYALVLDRSHSQTSELWNVARGLLQAMATDMGPDDRIVVLACDTACDEAPGGLAAANPTHVEGIEQFLDAQTMAGASDLGGMLTAGAEKLVDAGVNGGERERVLMYFGDGAPTAGELDTSRLLNQLKTSLQGVHLQAVALGARSDMLVLDALVRDQGGDLLQADSRDRPHTLVRELRLRAAVEPVREVVAELPPGMVQVHPKQLTAVRPGDSVVLMGKLSRPVDGQITLRGQGPDGQPVSAQVPVNLAANPGGSRSRHAHLPRSWAAEEIDHLTATQGDAARKTIISLSREYNVLSRYTAMLVLENDAMYREFNVVRASGRKDRWDGSLKDTKQPTTSTAVPIGGVTTKERDETKPVEEVLAESEDAEAPAPEPSLGLVGSGRGGGGSGSAGRASGAASRGDVSGHVGGVPGGIPGGLPNEPFGPPAQQAPAPSMDEEADAAYEGEAGFEDDHDGFDNVDKDVPMSQPSSKSKKAPAKKESRKPSRLDDPFDGGGGGGWSPLPRPRPRPKPRPQWQVSKASAPSVNTLNRLLDLRARRDASPGDRRSHYRLVTAAIRAGASEAFADAQNWAEADPDHATALLALADMLAARGDANVLRAYGSAAEVNSRSRVLQERLASAYTSKGDFTRACAHRRAVVSLQPTRGKSHLALAQCLAQRGDTEAAKVAALDGLARGKGDASALRKLADQLAAGLRPPANSARLHGGAELKATLTWVGTADLDIALVDSRGRRLSALRPRGIRVREQVGREELTLPRVSNKSMFIEVSRLDGGNTPIPATLKLKTPSGTRTFQLTVTTATQRLARVRKRKLRKWR